MPECPECIHRPERPSLTPLGVSHGPPSQPSPGAQHPHFSPSQGCQSLPQLRCQGVCLQSCLWPCLLQLLAGSPRRTLGRVHCLPFLGLWMDPAASHGSARRAQPLWDGTPWARAQPVQGSPSLTSVPEGAASPSLLHNGSSLSVSSNRLKHHSSLLTVNTCRLYKQGLGFSFRTNTQTIFT